MFTFLFAVDRNTLLGKVIRIDVDNEDPSGSRAYAIPEDNPFINEVDARPEIYAYGVRNIWRCDVDEGDPQTGKNITLKLVKIPKPELH